MTRRRRTIRTAGIPLALAILGAVGIAGAYAATAEPLVFHGSWAGPGGDATPVEDAPDRQRYSLPFVAGGRIAWGVEIRNTLLVPVTIRGLQAFAGDLAPLATAEELHLLRTDFVSVAPDDLRPFASLELAPGQAVFLAITAQFVDCASARQHWSPGSALVQDDLRLDVGVLGLPRLARVALPFSLRFQAPDETGCPAS